jgi:hypothetical protein
METLLLYSCIANDSLQRARRRPQRGTNKGDVFQRRRDDFSGPLLQLFTSCEKGCRLDPSGESLALILRRFFRFFYQQFKMLIFLIWHATLL